MKKNHRWLYLIATALLITAITFYLAGGCGGKKAPRAETRIPVLAEPAIAMDVPDEVHEIGAVEASTTVSVTARVGGQVLQVGFNEGQDVTAGEILFRIDPGPYQDALAQAQANIGRDRAGLKKAMADVERYEGLVKNDYVTKQDYDAVVSAADELKSAVDADQALLDNARLNFVYCTIRAPLAGRTGNLLIKQGDNIVANGPPLVVINQIVPIKVRFSVPEEQLDKIRDAAGKSELIVKTALSSDSTKTFEGKLAFIDNMVDTATGTVLLKATFPNTGRQLWPNQTVQVRLVLGKQENATVVPSAAVQTSQQGDFVWVVAPGDSAVIRTVVTGTMSGDKVVIDKGVMPGERIVTDGQFGLTPGAKVWIRTGLEPAARKGDAKR